MKVKIKKLSEDAVIPSYAKEGDAGLDLTAISKSYDEFGNIVYGTGLAFEIPEGYVGLLFPRSSNAKKDLYLTNHVGVIDSGYRGEISFKYGISRNRIISKNCDEKSTTYSGITNKIYSVGDRVGQLLIIPYPQIELEEVSELSESERGIGSYGSTDKKQ